MIKRTLIISCICLVVIFLFSCKKRNNSFSGTVEYVKQGDTTGTLHLAKGAEIVILNHGGGSPRLLYTIYTDNEGHYEIFDLAPRYYDIGAKYPSDSSFSYMKYIDLIYLDRNEDRIINLILK